MDTRPAPSLDDPVYRESVVDVLGLITYGELTFFERLAADCAMAPRLVDKAALATNACSEFRHFQQLCAYLEDLGVAPEEVMQPYVTRFDAWHESTAPSTWQEGLMKAYVGDSIAADFYREIAEFLDERTRALIVEVLADTGQEFVRTRLLEVIAADPPLGGRLALWGRRLMGEALSQAQVVAAERGALAGLFIGTDERPGVGLDVLIDIFGRLQKRHSERMAALGLDA